MVVAAGLGQVLGGDDTCAERQLSLHHTDWRDHSRRIQGSSPLPTGQVVLQSVACVIVLMEISFSGHESLISRVLCRGDAAPSLHVLL